MRLSDDRTVVSTFAYAVNVEPEIVLIARAIQPMALSLRDSRCQRMWGRSLMLMAINHYIIANFQMLRNIWPFILDGAAART